MRTRGARPAQCQSWSSPAANNISSRRIPLEAEQRLSSRCPCIVRVLHVQDLATAGVTAARVSLSVTTSTTFGVCRDGSQEHHRLALGLLSFFVFRAVDCSAMRYMLRQVWEPSASSRRSCSPPRLNPSPCRSSSERQTDTKPSDAGMRASKCAFTFASPSRPKFFLALFLHTSVLLYVVSL